MEQVTTVGYLVDKVAGMNGKAKSVFQAIKGMQENGYHDTEVIGRARKDQRYAVQLLLQEYDRLNSDLDDLMSRHVRFMND